MKCSNHVLLSGEGAMDFAKEQKLPQNPTIISILSFAINNGSNYNQVMPLHWTILHRHSLALPIKWAQLAQWLAINMEMLQQLQAQAE